MTAEARLERQQQVGELVDATVISGGPYDADAPGQAAEVVVVPTQVRRAGTASIRTFVQLALGLVTLVPFIVAGVYDGSGSYPAVVIQVLAVSTGITRVMALPQVEAFLQSTPALSWLAAAKGTNVLNPPV